MKFARVSVGLSGSALAAGLLASGPALAAPNEDLIGPLVSETFPGIGASATGSYPGGGLSGAKAGQATAKIAYDAARGTYTVTAGGRTQSFGGADRDAGQSGKQLDVYVHSSPSVQESLTLTRGATSGRFTYQYVGSAYWQRATTAGGGQGSFDAFVYGMPTAATAVPKTGSASYDIDILGAGTTFNGAAGISGSGTFDVKFDTGKFLLSASMTALYNSLLHPVLLQAQGTLGSDKTFRAPITVKFDPDTFRGTLDGRFFGPQAEEVGGAWSLTQYGGIGTVNAMIGTFMGRRGNGGSSATMFTSPAMSFALTGDGYSVTQGADSGSRKSVAGFDVRYAVGTDTFAVSRGSRSYTEQFYQKITTTGSEGMYPGQAQDALLEIDEGNALQYVRGGQWLRYANDAASNDAFVFGFQTTLVPVSGTAGYDVYLNGAFLDPVDHGGSGGLAGKGVLVADLGGGTYKFSGDAGVTRLGSSYADRQGTFGGSGRITAAKNLLAGTISVTIDGLGSFAGRANGHFYGPGAAEVGLAFGAVSANGSIAGTLIGAPADETAASMRPLALYGKPATFTSRPVYLEVGAGWSGTDFPMEWENTAAMKWDPVKRQYNVSFDQYVSRALPLTFGPKQASATASTALYDGYVFASDGRKWTAQVYKQGSTEIKLTYTSFARITTPLVSKPGTVSKDVFYWVPFGSTTAPAFMPRTGKATYALAARGDAVLFSEKREHLAVTGTGTLTTDFARQQLALTASYTGTTGTGTAVKMGKLNYTGSIQGSEWRASTHLAGGLTNTAGGYFFGLDGREVGGNFVYRNEVLFEGYLREVIGTGVLVGTRK